MLKFLYNARLGLTILAAIFAGSAFQDLFSGKPLTFSVLISMALLAFVLLLLGLYKENGTIINTETLIFVITVVIGTLIFVGLWNIASTMNL